MKGCKEIRDKLSPEWLRDCVMYNENQQAIIISPFQCLKHGITNLKLAQNRFAGKTILQFRLDFNIIHEKDKRKE